jgi:conjugative transfer signal peptidase TraF
MYFATVVFVGYVIVTLHLRFNFTSSMPLGIYRLVPVSKRPIQRGMLVAVCASPEVAKLGRRRRYLAVGPCPHDSELLLKTVAAVAGDYVDNSVTGVAVNGCLLPHSSSLRYDTARRRLLPWSEAHHQLQRGQLWLYADDDRSWDSRYWGPSATTDVWAGAMPLLTILVPATKWSTRFRCGRKGTVGPVERRSTNCRGDAMGVGTARTAELHDPPRW